MPGAIPDINTLPIRLRAAREQTGLGQMEFADRAGLSRAGVSNAERGESTPRRSTLKLWALASGVPVQWIETGTAPSPDGDGAGELPRLDSNQQPFDYPSSQVTVRSLRTLSSIAA